MAEVFISYRHDSDYNYNYAEQLFELLKLNEIDAWFAPKDIFSGEDFTERIGENLKEADVLILVLSKEAMESRWVKKEVVGAVNQDKYIIPIQIDHEKLINGYDYLLEGIQIINDYHLRNISKSQIIEDIKKKIKKRSIKKNVQKERYSEQELGVRKITGGDPYYIEDETLFVKLSGEEFYLAPPQEVLTNQATQDWMAEHHFSFKDKVFSEDLDTLLEQIPIEDLRVRIEKSRKKIFKQFQNHENGCYFNNKKYGVERINPFARTEDEVEDAKLTIRLFVTDYFSHRVMKDVCKQLIAEKNKYISQIDYNHIGPEKIFFTSLGINLLLLENPLNDKPGVLITSRSTNAAETYSKRKFSLSVIEGVSISDYDSHWKNVRLTTAVERGLKEELNVTQEVLKRDSLKFYDFFVNRENLEMGISCTIDLKKEITLEKDILDLHGKDEELEIADKRKVAISDLETFVRNNQSSILPQAMYVFCTFLENKGLLMIDYQKNKVLKRESYICAKNGIEGTCGDKLVESENFYAVIDGATPKGKRLWNNQRGDVYISEILGQAITKLEPDIDAQAAVEELNDVVKQAYKEQGITFDELQPEEQLQASVLIYSVAKKEVWSFGDCMLRINQKSYRNIKKGDIMLSDLRAFCIEAANLEGVNISDSQTDYGRNQILPFLKRFTLFANAASSFGYDVINGGEIHKNRVQIYAVQPGDHVVMASDGYPKLFDTLDETEDYLKQSLIEDHLCIGKLRGTKGIEKGNTSYDDRCFIGFTVEK